MQSNEKMFYDVLSRIASTLEGIRMELGILISLNKKETQQAIKESKNRDSRERQILMETLKKQKVSGKKVV